MSWTERLNETLPRLRLGASVVDIHEWAHQDQDQPMDGPPHRHSYVVACRVEGGEADFIAGERRHRVGPGDLLFARPGVRHRIVGAEGFRISWISFEVTPGPAGDDASLVLQGFLAAESAVVTDPGLVGAVWELLKEAARGPRTPGQTASLAALGPALLVSLARAGGGDTPPRRSGSRNGMVRTADGSGRDGVAGVGEGSLARPGVGEGGLARPGDRGDGGDGLAGVGEGGLVRPGNGGDGLAGVGMGNSMSAGDGSDGLSGMGGGHDRGAGGAGGEAPATTEPTPERHLRAVRLAVRYIHDNLDRPLRVEELAKQVNVSPRQLTRLFATLLNEPPASYVERVRLEHAARLLAHTQTPIKQIATDLGYPDVPTFTRAFARQHQSPPGRFRRTYSINGDRD